MEEPFRTLDHVVIAVRDLEAATERYASLLGRAPSWRGAHPGDGTANALFRLDRCYLELIAPRSDGAQARAVAAVLDARGEGLVAMALGTPDLEATLATLRERGLALTEPREGQGREATSGAERAWRSAFVHGPDARGLGMLAIEHRSPADVLPVATPMVARDAAVEGLDHVVVASPDLSAARRLYAEVLGLRLALERSFEARGIQILFFRLGGVTIEVVGKLEPETGAEDRFGGLAYRVPDVAAARERLHAAGFDVSGVRTGAKPGTRVCSVRDGIHGVPTLLIGPGDPAPARQRGQSGEAGPGAGR